jgi:hypothetical protein
MASSLIKQTYRKQQSYHVPLDFCMCEYHIFYQPTVRLHLEEGQAQRGALAPGIWYHHAAVLPIMRSYVLTEEPQSLLLAAK